MFFGTPIFLLFAGIIFAPAGLLYCLSILWIVAGKWLFMLLGIKIDEYDQIGFDWLWAAPFIIAWNTAKNFTLYGRID